MRLLVVLSMFCVCDEIDGVSPFISIKASRVTIEEYEEVMPTISSSADEPYPQYMQVNITTRSEKFIFDFIKNDDIFSDDFMSVIVDGNTMVEDTNVYANCYYTGKVRNNSVWIASMSTCQGIQMEFGDNTQGSNFFHVEPMDKDDPSMEQMHAFYKHSQHTSSTGRHALGCRVVNPPYTASSSTSSRTTSQQMGSQSSNYTVEFVLVNDQAQYKAFGGNRTFVVQRAIYVANGMNTLYQSLNITVTLTAVITFVNGNPFPVSTDPVVVIENFQNYSAFDLRGIPRDNIMLLSGIEFFGGTVGIAYLGTMCLIPYSVGVTQDGGLLPLNEVITIATHEMGHNFNMEHDDDNDGNLTCNCPDESGCIMAAFVTQPPATKFSNCSVLYLKNITNQLDTCLLNARSETGPRCGNGIVEGSETCDCGVPEYCNNPCCNATICQPVDGAQCFSGLCCNLNTCKFQSRGVECRSIEEEEECDVPESCTGDSPNCPPDMFAANGSPCFFNYGYCYNGRCPTHFSQCLNEWNATSESTNCYDLNRRGDTYGHCGHNGTAFAECSESNILCGLLQCTNGSFQYFYDALGNEQEQVLNGDRCGSFGVVNDFDNNPGLVDEGTKCGDNKMCIGRECRDLSTLNFPSCPRSEGFVCSGQHRGICNSLGQCHCFDGYTGTACEQDAPTASITTDAPSTAPATTAAPSTAPPTSVAPSTVPSTAGTPSTAPPTTGNSSTAPQSTAPSTTGAPSTAPPATSKALTSAPPTTNPPSTAPPTTNSPTTNSSSEAPPTQTTGSPFTLPPSTTEQSSESTENDTTTEVDFDTDAQQQGDYAQKPIQYTAVSMLACLLCIIDQCL